jgi:O-methyltransferase
MFIPKYSKIPAKIKGLFFYFRLHLLFNWLSNSFIFFGNISRLSKWIEVNKNKGFSTYYSYKFNYADRFKLHEYIISSEKLENINYLEFGVFDGGSFLWWADKLKYPSTRFYGFDTFEGLPENWGAFKAGEMESGIPSTSDSRCNFVKGLFQDTLPGFLKTFDNSKRMVIHMDADLFSSTLYVLTSIAPYLKSGDIIMFDEFNVPNHEFFAFDIFIKAYYIKYEVLGGVNNYYQTAIKII